MRPLRFVLTGVGRVGRSFLEVWRSRAALLEARYGLSLRAVGVADGSGAAWDPDGLDVAAIVALKAAGEGVARLPGRGRAGVSARALVDEVAADLLLEATPSGPADGQPGLAVIGAALDRGMDVVMASKGPLVCAYAGLAARSDLGGRGPRLRFSGAVGGALASINLGRRDLAGGRIARVEAVLNATTQVILELRARGLGAGEALAEAQRLGIAEPDARLDLEGWDAASKLVILANAALGRPTRLGDVAVRGIADVEDELLRAAAGGRVSLLATAEASGGSVDAPDWRLTVAPTVLAAGHPLARLVGGELGVVFESDVFGRTVLTSRADGPIGTAAAMLRDVIEVAGLRG